MQTPTDLQTYIRLAPKAELHVHLEGSIQPATLLILAQRNGVNLPAQTVPELRSWFSFRDFNHFIDIYTTISSCLITREDFELITYEFGATMARQNIRYAEATFSPDTHRFSRNISFDVFFNGLTEGRKRAKADFGVEIRWIFDIVRNVEDASRNAEHADFTTSVAIEGKHDGVIGLGLGGAEVGYPPERFEKWFEKGRAAGLHSVPHAGETVGPESIWGALRVLGAERIGHGVRSIEDPALIAYLAEHQIPLEVAPTSNIRLGVYASMDKHPLPLLYQSGIPVIVNSDDPPLFNTDLTNDLLLLDTAFKYDLQTINEILLNGVRWSFLPTDQKSALEAQFLAELGKLEKEI